MRDQEIYLRAREKASCNLDCLDSDRKLMEV
jgi:hypothetical protein